MPGTWSYTGSLNSARSGHTATQLWNGQVLVAGGVGSSALPTNAELYNGPPPPVLAWRLYLPVIFK